MSGYGLAAWFLWVVLISALFVGLSSVVLHGATVLPF